MELEVGIAQARGIAVKIDFKNQLKFKTDCPKIIFYLSLET